MPSALLACSCWRAVGAGTRSGHRRAARPWGLGCARGRPKKVSPIKVAGGDGGARVMVSIDSLLWCCGDRLAAGSSPCLGLSVPVPAGERGQLGVEAVIQLPAHGLLSQLAAVMCCGLDWGRGDRVPGQGLQLRVAGRDPGGEGAAVALGCPALKTPSGNEPAPLCFPSLIPYTLGSSCGVRIF